MTANSPTHEEISRGILAGVARVSVPPKASSDVQLNDKLEDLNIDSLGFLELLIEMENRYGITFADEFTSPDAHTTVQGLIDYLESALSERFAPSDDAATNEDGVTP